MSAQQSSVKMERFAVLQSAVAAAIMLTMETTAKVSGTVIIYTCK